MFAIALGFVCLVLLAIYFMARPGGKRTGLYLPDFVTASLVAYAIGAGAIYAGSPYQGSQSVTLMAELALIFACAGMSTASLIFKRSYPKDYVRECLVNWRFVPGEQASIFLGLAVGAIVCVFFSQQLLSNKAVSSLLAGAFQDLGFGNRSLLQARKAITNGTDGYFAPGFVKQFRDILVPILLSSVILMATRQPLSKNQSFIVLAASASALLAMVLVAVRSNFFLFFISLFVAQNLAQRVYQSTERYELRTKARARWRMLLFIVAILIYGVFTILLGRVTVDTDISGILGEVLYNLLDRIVMTVPRENIDSYAFWVHLGPSFGSFWLADMSGILPGSAAIGLSNLLHQYNGGSLEGNSSLGMAVDVWINWGWFGLVVWPFIYGVWIGFFDCLLTNLRSPIAFGIKVVLALALLKIYNPFGFLLYGGVTSVLLYVGLKISNARNRSVNE